MGFASSNSGYRWLVTWCKDDEAAGLCLYRYVALRCWRRSGVLTVTRSCLGNNILTRCCTSRSTGWKAWKVLQKKRGQAAGGVQTHIHMRLPTFTSCRQFPETGELEHFHPAAGLKPTRSKVRPQFFARGRLGRDKQRALESILSVKPQEARGWCWIWQGMDSEDVVRASWRPARTWRSDTRTIRGESATTKRRKSIALCKA